jgi:hypothetical protein
MGCSWPKPRPFLNFVWIEDLSHGEAPPAQHGTSPVPRGEPVTAQGDTITDEKLITVFRYQALLLGFGRRLFYS